MRSRTIIVFCMLLGLMLAVQGVSAQTDTPTDDEVNRVAKQLYCPVCENTPLDVCPTVACAQWRQTIREKLALGWSDQQVRDYFVTQYGERVLAQPSTRGLNVFVWIIPPLAVAAGVVLWWRFMRRATSPPRAVVHASQTADLPVLDELYVARLEQDLRQHQ